MITNFTRCNVLRASNQGATNNWELYGDIKLEGGKMRIGFATRFNNNIDKHEINNDFYYAYSYHLNGIIRWKKFDGGNISLPVMNLE